MNEWLYLLQMLIGNRSRSLNWKEMRKPRNFEVRFWRTHKPLPEGWKRTGTLSGTHHGHYADIIVRDS